MGSTGMSTRFGLKPAASGADDPKPITAVGYEAAFSSRETRSSCPRPRASSRGPGARGAGKRSQGGARRSRRFENPALTSPPRVGSCGLRSSSAERRWARRGVLYLLYSPFELTCAGRLSSKQRPHRGGLPLSGLRGVARPLTEVVVRAPKSRWGSRMPPSPGRVPLASPHTERRPRDG